ncbi:hypothetical protein ACFQY4_19605 [Catellatospora bangladeshensis]|uniref:hypothetical protein n=1 Tax=Catellatospora bangladeshensis TaxID=310355 RepID=UPI003616DEE7
MNVSAPTPSPLVDGVDVDAVAGAARACPGVDDLLGGFPEVATYLPGRRVTGVRITDDTVELCLRADWGSRCTRSARRYSTRLHHWRAGDPSTSPSPRSPTLRQPGGPRRSSPPLSGHNSLRRTPPKHLPGPTATR